MKTKPEFTLTPEDKIDLYNIANLVKRDVIGTPHDIKLSSGVYPIVFRPSSNPENDYPRLEILAPKYIEESTTNLIWPSLGLIRGDKLNYPDKLFFKPAKPGHRHYLKEIKIAEDKPEEQLKLVENEADKTANSPYLKGKPLCVTPHSFFITMNRIEGPDLYQLGKETGLSNDDIANIIFAILTAYKTEFADKKLMHGDIKPENIIVIKMNGRYVARFIDLSHTMTYDELEAEKAEGTLNKSWGGTLIFTAPEIIASAIYNPQNDMYSLGLTIAELLGNKRLAAIDEEVHSPDNKDLSFEDRLDLLAQLREKGIFDFSDDFFANAYLPLLQGLTRQDLNARFGIEAALAAYGRIQGLDYIAAKRP